MKNRLSHLYLKSLESARGDDYYDRAVAVAYSTDELFAYFDHNNFQAIKHNAPIPAQCRYPNEYSDTSSPRPSAPLDPAKPGDALAIVIKETVGVTDWKGCGCEKPRRSMNALGWEQCWENRDRFMAYVRDKAKASGIAPTPRQTVAVVTRLWRMSREAGFKVSWPSAIGFAIRQMYPGREIDAQTLQEPPESDSGNTP